jgi:hypothetical protein
VDGVLLELVEDFEGDVLPGVDVLRATRNKGAGKASETPIAERDTDKRERV